MNLLLDTHAFLWWLLDSPRLSPAAREAIGDPENSAWVSAVVAWECATKHRLGKMPEAEPFVRQAARLVHRAGMNALPISISHGQRAGDYAVGHADPFDRMLAAQAEIEDLVLVSKDPAFAAFPVKTLW